MTTWAVGTVVLLLALPTVAIPLAAEDGTPAADPYINLTSCEVVTPVSLQIIPASEYISAKPVRTAKSGLCGSQSSVFGGAEFLLVRPTFSESIAFAKGTQTLTTYDVAGRMIEFGYEPSVRAFVGYRFEDSDWTIKFTYWHMSASTADAGTVGAPGEFIVDPFGSIVGAVGVVDPTDARFGSVLVGGTAIETRTEVSLDAYDLDFVVPIASPACLSSLTCNAGVRIADIDQYYESTVFAGAFPVTYGDYHVDFLGTGPHVGFCGVREFSSFPYISLFASMDGSLLFGSYDVSFSNSVPGFSASQVESQMRAVPVLESELGMNAQLSSWLNVSAGWMFQSWFDLGTSGGTFGGFFTGADDGNIMSVDGLFVRGELAY
jgi:hypothetical protein